MYGKYHASTFTGSMRGAGTNVFAVWGWIIANANQHSVVEINPDIVAFLLGCTPEEVTEAIEKLCAVDERSRCKDNDGRRLIREGEFQYFVPTHNRYRSMRTSDEKREYNRVKKREQRERQALQADTGDKGDVKPPVKNVKVVDTTEAEAEAEEKAEATPPKAPAKPRRSAPLECPAFTQFWTAYPRKLNKAKAEQAWVKHACATILPQILKAVRDAKASPDWSKDGGQFIPHPASWLNNRRWEDDFTTFSAQAGTRARPLL
jgi:hypothetical protein